MPKRIVSSSETQRDSVRRLLVGAAIGKVISERNLKKIRRRLTQRPGWRTADFDAHVAECVLEGIVEVRYRANEILQEQFRVAGRTPQLALPFEAQAAAASCTSSAAREVHRVQAAVMRWVKRRCRIVDGRWDVESAHLRHMKQNLRASAVAVQATVAILMARGVLVMQQRDREKTRGRKRPSPLIHRVLEWAATQGWIQRSDVHDLHARACSVSSTDCATADEEFTGKTEQAIIELGCGWEGATEGLRSVCRNVVTLDRHQQVISSRNHREGGRAMSYPSVLADFRRPCSNLVHWVRQQAGLSKEEACVVWASPSCKGHSKRQGMLRHRPEGQGKFAGKPIDPEEKEATDRVFAAVWEWWCEDETRQYCVENVETADMGPEVQERFGPGVVVKACRFGKLSGKTHRLWLTREAETAFLDRYNDPSRTPRCPYCDVRPARRHPQSGLPKKGSGQSREAEQGKTRTAAANRTRPELAAAIGETLLEVHARLSAS